MHRHSDPGQPMELVLISRDRTGARPARSSRGPLAAIRLYAGSGGGSSAKGGPSRRLQARATIKRDDRPGDRSEGGAGQDRVETIRIAVAAAVAERSGYRRPAVAARSAGRGRSGASGGEPPGSGVTGTALKMGTVAMSTSTGRRRRAGADRPPGAGWSRPGEARVGPGYGCAQALRGSPGAIRVSGRRTGLRGNRSGGCARSSAKRYSPRFNDGGTDPRCAGRAR